MKIGKKTFDILKNFSGIRSSIFVDAGNTIRTMSNARNIVAEVKVEEDFPKPFAIFDLGKFIATTSLFTDPDYSFDDKFVSLDSKGSAVKYYYAEEKLVEKAKSISRMPDLVASFPLSSTEITEIQKAASVLQLDTLCIRDKNAGIEIIAFDRKVGLDSSSNCYTKTIQPSGATDKFSAFIDIDLLKMIPDDYSVQIGIGQISVAKFTGTKNGVAYWIALRPETSKS
jgi:hypothetical protein